MCSVSIIVPVYNVEKYIKECIESLISQSFKDIEILLINDGSKDKSGDICNEYARKDNRIKVFNKENEGLSKTREYGITRAKGEFVSFVDSDDFVEKDFIKELYDAIVESDADIAECDYNIFSSNFIKRKLLYSKSFIANKEEFKEKNIKSTILNGDVAVVVWNKLYKKENIINFIKDYGESPLEDYIFNMQYYAGVNRYVYVGKPLINYRQLPNSLSKTYNRKTYSILQNVNRIKKKFMEETGLIDDECVELSNKWYAKYTYNFLKNIIVMNNGLTLREKKSEVMSVAQDIELRQICCDIKNRNSFENNIVYGKYKRIIRGFMITRRISKIKQKLSSIKRILTRS